MPYRLLADAVLLLHFGFIAFVIGGALLAWRWPRAAWLHLPALAWGAYAVLFGVVCPLTPLENSFRVAAGDIGYEASFIEHYLLPLVYPGAVQGATGRRLQAGLGVALIVFNTLAYGLLGLYRHRRGSRRDAARP